MNKTELQNKPFMKELRDMLNQTTFKAPSLIEANKIYEAITDYMLDVESDLRNDILHKLESDKSVMEACRSKDSVIVRGLTRAIHLIKEV